MIWGPSPPARELGRRRPSMLLLPLLLSSSLLCSAADGFVLHVESSCVLDDQETPQDFSYCISFNKMALVCWDDQSEQLEACHFGVLSVWARLIADYLNNDTALIQRLRDGPRACLSFTKPFWGALTNRTRPPSVVVTETRGSDGREAAELNCRAWGFYPGRLSMQWLKNGRPVQADGAHRDPQPAGDWTYEARLRLRLPLSTRPGDVYTCAVSHPAGPRVLLVHWEAGLSPQQSLKVSVSLVILGLGLLLFAFALFRCRTARSAGYIPISGSNYPEGRNF
ncbi:HLA class II histocompatibility antigen, DM beta chain [Tachyglossus aculeatus]|uniref:HLA class II histocompatibility antigen, DM beta chain n=1 Tax=Tachyglossus aculeatus TaxID=9261 RepID=UPI0018F377FC|nr:HLA class II histocompatibility antigen, DM beta chain [Tachyglossus aculeatus]